MGQLSPLGSKMGLGLQKPSKICYLAGKNCSRLQIIAIPLQDSILVANIQLIEEISCRHWAPSKLIFLDLKIDQSVAEMIGTDVYSISERFGQCCPLFDISFRKRGKLRNVRWGNYRHQWQYLPHFIKCMILVTFRPLGAFSAPQRQSMLPLVSANSFKVFVRPFWRDLLDQEI